MRKLDVILLLASGAITSILLGRNLYWAAAWGAFLLTALFVSLIYERGYKKGLFHYHNTITPKLDKVQEKIQSHIKELERSSH